MRCPVLLLLLGIVPTAAALALSSTTARKSAVSAMTQWAKEQGIVMHENLQWKQYDHDPTSGEGESNNWGLELKEAVPVGTTLVKVPKDLVLNADSIYEEFLETDSERLPRALERLGDFGIHKEVFLIVLKLLRCSKQVDHDSHRWSPWIQALPKTFPEFSSSEIECLPLYARTAAVYQANKFQAFCSAAAELDEWKEDDPTDTERLKWAFQMGASRCWKTDPSGISEASAAETATTELVPVGDMFNHREPANLILKHDGDSVNFVYKGDANNDNKGLYLSYGTPYNPHRFLVMFGFCPEEMPEVWSHLYLPNNPFSEDASKMVFRTSDGAIPDAVWDAVLYELLKRNGMMFSLSRFSEDKEEMHAKYRFATSAILRSHVAKSLEELAELRQKIENTQGKNLALIRQHNEFLTLVFSRVQAQLDDDDDDGGEQIPKSEDSDSRSTPRPVEN